MVIKPEISFNRFFTCNKMPIFSADCNRLFTDAFSYPIIEEYIELFGSTLYINMIYNRYFVTLPKYTLTCDIVNYDTMKNRLNQDVMYIDITNPTCIYSFDGNTNYVNDVMGHTNYTTSISYENSHITIPASHSPAINTYYMYMGRFGIYPLCNSYVTPFSSNISFDTESYPWPWSPPTAYVFFSKYPYESRDSTSATPILYHFYYNTYPGLAISRISSPRQFIGGYYGYYPYDSYSLDAWIEWNPHEYSEQDVYNLSFTATYRGVVDFNGNEIPSKVIAESDTYDVRSLSCRSTDVFSSDYTDMNAYYGDYPFPDDRSAVYFQLTTPLTYQMQYV